jgi:hypothetical protein
MGGVGCMHRSSVECIALQWPSRAEQDLNLLIGIARAVWRVGYLQLDSNKMAENKVFVTKMRNVGILFPNGDWCRRL